MIGEMFQRKMVVPQRTLGQWASDYFWALTFGFLSVITAVGAGWGFWVQNSALSLLTILALIFFALSMIFRSWGKLLTERRFKGK